MSIYTDFVAIQNDLKRTVSYEVVTKTIDPMSGTETSSYATATNKTMIFFLNDNKWLFDKDGLIETGDAYVMAETSVGIKKFDRITVDGETYIIKNTTTRVFMGVTGFEYGILYKV